MSGTLYVVSGPAGVGKGTVLSEVLKKIDRIGFSVSCTTRLPRPGLDVEGKTYYFISKEDFLKRAKADEFLEYASVHGHYYGTRRDIVESALAEGNDIVLEIDVQGAIIVKKKMPKAVTVFIKPPSFEELERRLKGRGSESEEEQSLRLNNAKKELTFADKYDYSIVNDTVANASNEFIKIINRYREEH